MIVRNWVISIRDTPIDNTPPQIATYPAEGANNVYRDVVVKAFFSEPVNGVNAATFTLTDSHGARIPAWVDQIGDGAWGLFPNPILLKAGEKYTAHLKRGTCDAAGNCTGRDVDWNFKVAPEGVEGSGDTSIPMGFKQSMAIGGTRSSVTKSKGEQH